MIEPDVAVIIPTLNEAKRIKLLVNYLAALGFSEIVVSDGGSSDGTPEIVEGEPRVKVVRTKKGRGYQLNQGMQTCSAPLVLLLHADTMPPPDAVSVIRTTLAPPHVSAGCFQLSFDDPGYGLSIYAFLSRFETSVSTFGDQGFFARRSTLEHLKGIPEQPLFEDVELRRRLRSIGQFVKVDARVVTSARRFQESGVVLGQLRNAFLLLAYYVGVSPKFLCRLYGISTSDQVPETR